MAAAGQGKHDKFVELATKRVNKAINDIRLIGNLSNKKTYEYSPAEAKKIHSALRRELAAMKARFDDGGGSTENTFSL